MATRMGNKTRQAILEAAREAFASKSYAEVSMEDIAKIAHVKKPLIYYYFPSKEDLFKEAWDEAFRDLEDKVFGPKEEEGKYVRKVKQFLRAYIDFLRNDRKSLRLIEREKNKFYSEKSKNWQYMKKRYDVFVQQVADVIASETGNSSPEFARAITDIVGSSALLPEGQMSPKTLELIIIKGLKP